MLKLFRNIVWCKVWQRFSKSQVFCKPLELGGLDFTQHNPYDYWINLHSFIMSIFRITMIINDLQGPLFFIIFWSHLGQHIIFDGNAFPFAMNWKQVCRSKSKQETGALKMPVFIIWAFALHKIGQTNWKGRLCVTARVSRQTVCADTFGISGNLKWANTKHKAQLEV